MNTPIPFSTQTTPVRFFWDTPIPIPPPLTGWNITRELQIKNNLTGEDINITGITGDVFLHDNTVFYSESRTGFNYRHRLKQYRPAFLSRPAETIFSAWTNMIPFKVAYSIDPGIGGPGGIGITPVIPPTGPGGTVPPTGPGGTLGGNPNPVKPPPALTSTALAGFGNFSFPLVVVAILAVFFFFRKK